MVQDVAIYTDYKLDESYTPTRISVRVGTNFNDLQEIEVHAGTIVRIRILRCSGSGLDPDLLGSKKTKMSQLKRIS
jgi:hypothetical protein